MSAAWFITGGLVAAAFLIGAGLADWLDQRRIPIDQGKQCETISKAK